MRLIDADALKAEWYRINDIDETDRGVRFVGYTEIARLIDNAPTVQADGDLISRQDAIAEFRDGRDVYDIMESIEELPSAPDSRQRGEWIWKDRHIKRTRQVKGTTADGEETVVSVHEDYIEQRPYCSECGKWNDSDHLSYCPSCGADMRKPKWKYGDTDTLQGGLMSAT